MRSGISEQILPRGFEAEVRLSDRFGCKARQARSTLARVGSSHVREDGDRVKTDSAMRRKSARRKAQPQKGRKPFLVTSIRDGAKPRTLRVDG